MEPSRHAFTLSVRKKSEKTCLNFETLDGASPERRHGFTIEPMPSLRDVARDGLLCTFAI
jgi:hypothetical protein